MITLNRRERTAEVGSRHRYGNGVVTAGAWLVALLWMAPLVYAFWAAFHPRELAARFDLSVPWTLANFPAVWSAAPFGRYYLNTVVLVTGILAAQLLLGILAAYAFARYTWKGRDFLLALVLIQILVMPDVLLVQNYNTISTLNLLDTLTGIGLPYIASAFCIFLLRQAFLVVPTELVEAATMEGLSRLQTLWRVYVPIAKPTIVAFALVSISHHWNNFLWPLVVTNSVESRPLTVGLAIFNTTESGLDWTLISTAAVIVIAPLLAIFLLFQRQFVQSFMRAGIR
jgi:sn-glycerol 3-phosphate transport system permease protein